MRPTKGNEIWNKQKQFVVFYDMDEFPVATFDSIYEIVVYKGLEKTKANYDLTAVELYNALKKESRYTEMLGKPMTVHLIDIEY